MLRHTFNNVNVVAEHGEAGYSEHASRRQENDNTTGPKILGQCCVECCCLLLLCNQTRDVLQQTDMTHSLRGVERSWMNA